MEKFCQILISAKTKAESNKLSDALIVKKLIAGARITNGPSRYWWNGKIEEEEDYYNISAFSLAKNKAEIISEVKKIHSDKCPIIAFFEMDGNAEFLKWIEESVR